MRFYILILVFFVFLDVPLRRVLEIVFRGIAYSGRFCILILVFFVFLDVPLKESTRNRFLYVLPMRCDFIY